MKYQKISLEIKENVAYLGLGLDAAKSMTTLCVKTLEEIKEAVAALGKQQLSGLIFFSHRPGVFLAGVDISIFETLKNESEAADGSEQGQKIYNMIEDLPFPTVCAVDGVCLGGGLELALSCKVIIASDSSKTSLGLPEVKLGILPGFGGTYRLPKKIGLPLALDYILSGKSANARKAKAIGLVHEIYAPERLLAMSLKHLSPLPVNFKESLSKAASNNFLSRKVIFQKARESVLKKTRGHYEAPLRILDLMESGAGRSRESYLAREAQTFGELCASEQSLNLRHIFFLTEAAKKFATGPFNPKAMPTRGAALGAGTMGGGIAWLLADNDMRPIMKDITLSSLELGLKQASSNFQSALKRKRLTADEFERKQRSISPQLTYKGMKEVDLVIEAIVENMELKKKVFSEVEKEVRDDCLLTSNTSSLSVTEMSQSLRLPGRFLGLHFFNPVHKMPLVEIITHPQVDPQALEVLYRWCLKVKKTPVVVKDGPGFLVNRILGAYLNEAGYLLEEGVSLKDIDRAALNFGMPMGPFRLMDEVGLDVASKVGKILNDGLGARFRPSSVASQLVEKGLLGKKNSKGLYLYVEGEKSEVPNEEFLKNYSQNMKMDEIEIQKRLFLPMINEAAYILGEKLVESAGQVDLALIFGIGFPPFRGGLLRYADSEGTERIGETIKEFAQKVDKDRYQLSPYLQQLVSAGKGFY